MTPNPRRTHSTSSSAQRIVVLTGVSRGLGRALLVEFVRRGHTVLGCARDPAALAALQERFGAPHDLAAVDVASGVQVAEWARRLLARYPAPDLLLNNAAVINRNAPLWAVPADEFDRVLDVNVKGVTHVLRQFVPAMIRQQRGVIVNFSSGWGRATDAEVAPYCASKWAIEGLTQALAQDLPPGLAAIPLNPGIIDTDMLRSCFGASAANYPSPEDWAGRAVPFLLGLGPEHNGRPLTVP
ncbi:MAG: SDR family oxidoreductase [Verrucomicrobia bacterium]|nr:SDR family oxidoreductase [Verrucomicrobiota bacterium]